MTKRLLFIFYLAVSPISIFMCACNGAPNNLPIENKVDSISINKMQTEIYIDLQKTLSIYTIKNATNVNVTYDHYFKTSKEYKGYDIKQIIASIIKSVNFDTTKCLVVFECKDGYKPAMDISKVFGQINGYIVYKNENEINHTSWPDSLNEKFKPYYIVWDNVKKEDDTFMWPFGLIGLRLVKMDIEFKEIYPSKDLSLINGFTLFRNNCMKCHSINKVGGTIGPELNIPRNITEYWKVKDIISFAKDPRSYRINSSMPPIINLSELDLNEIVKYLKYMKGNKLKY